MLDPQSRRGPVDSAAIYTHSRTRTTSSNIFPPPGQTSAPPHPMEHQQYYQQYPPQHQQQQYPQQQYAQHYQQHPQQNLHYARRSPSVNTFSTSSTAGPPPAAYRMSPTDDIRRSTSSRSGGGLPQAASYVAALRRQRGTVWCDRAQPEDLALAAQLRAAKAKASRTVSGTGRLSAGGYGSSGAASGRTGTGISTTGKVAAKIRHHGKPGVVGYAPGENHVGVGGVPPRLSATEVEGESTDDEGGQQQQQQQHPHRRAGSSGRSSIGSGRQRLSHRATGGPGSRGGTPSRQGSLAESIAERSGGAAAAAAAGAPSDAASATTRSIEDGAGSGSGSGRAQSMGGGSSSGEKADDVAELGQDPGVASKSRRAADAARERGGSGLERRGSVDERSVALSAGRLYIANPD